MREINRRSVIKSLGTGALATAGVPKVIASSNGAKFSGLAYDPVTHEILGEASAQFNDVHGDLRGNLRVGDHRVNVNKAEKFDQGGHEGFTETKYGFDETQGQTERAKYVRVTAVDDSITGYVQRDRTKVAYSLVPQQRYDGSLNELLRQSRLTTGE